MYRLAAFIMGMTTCVSAWAAPNLTLLQSVSPELYVRGRTLEISVTIGGSLDGESLFSLGFEQLLPAGWTYEGLVVSSTTLQIVPPLGDKNLLEFAFSGAVTDLPQNLVFLVRPSLSSTTPVILSGKSIGVFSNSGVVDGPEELAIQPDPSAAWSSMDLDRDNVVSLSELLRLVQLFNSANGFHCDEDSLDGFAIGPGDRTCVGHSSDYLGDLWTISLSELLRAVQLFRLGGYFACDSGEDGYCTGAP